VSITPSEVEPRRAHERALQLFGDRVRGVADDRWSSPTPCAEWDVRALVNHCTAENYWAEQLLTGRTIEDVGDRFAGDLLGDTPVDDYEDSARRAREAANRDGALNRDIHVSYGPISGAAYLEHRWVDLVVHAWDLAVATRQDPALPYDLVAEALDLMLAQEEAVRGSGVFGPEVDVSGGAPALDRLVAFLGRDPERWVA
jgi:uncharacterized protein (TIGR03086 family)